MCMQFIYNTEIRGFGAGYIHRDENKELTCGRRSRRCKRVQTVIKILKNEVDALLFEK